MDDRREKRRELEHHFGGGSWKYPRIAEFALDQVALAVRSQTDWALICLMAADQAGLPVERQRLLADMLSEVEDV